MGKRLMISFVIILIGISGQGQIDSSRLLTNGYFINPVDHTMKLSGSFGELRTNHFHSGIDIKSKKGAIGDTIRAAADGYISRIKLMRGSYGKVLYIDHPNGYTTVYAHMQRFAPKVEAYIRSRQREAQSYEVDVYPSEEKLVFRQGQYLGHLGNTGRSYGPHLHFEVRNTKTEMPQNPYLHGIGPDDNKHPLLYAVAAQGFDRSLLPISSETNYINETKSKGKYGPSHTYKIPAWRAAMSIQAFDQMNGSSNKNGVYKLKMYVDDTLHYESIIDSVYWDETKYINSYIEYADKKEANRTMIRCYRQKANELQVYNNLKNNGFFKIFQNKTRLIRFEAIDFYGNTSSYECKVVRSEIEAKNDKAGSFSKVITYDKDYDFKLGVSHIQFPKGATDNTLMLNYDQKRTGNLVKLVIGKSNQPLFKRVRVTLPVSHITPSLREKTVFVYTNGGSPTSFGGHLEGDSLTVNIDKLGKYELTIDTIGPEITPLEYKKNAQDRIDFKFRLKDNFSTRGAAKDIQFNVYIDDIWTICYLKAMGDILTIPLEDVSKGDHKLYIIATDHSGNTTKWNGRFSR